MASVAPPPRAPLGRTGDPRWESMSVAKSRTVNQLGAALRVGFGALALAAVIYQLTVQIDDGASVSNFLSFFTIESNILAGLVLLVTGLAPGSRRPMRWDDLRGAATVYMVATGLVYNTLLLDVDVGNLASWVNNVTHRLIPLVMLAD